MSCKLCLQNKSLCGSHIISECFYDKVYDSKHRFLPLSTEDTSLQFQQKGFREDLLCHDCERLLSGWESTLKRDFVDIGKETSNFLTINRVHEKIVKVESLRYDNFKLGVLSLLWRFSITSQPFFSKYQLGPYEEKLRQLLLSSACVPEKHYPIMVAKCKLDSQYFPDVMMGFPPHKSSQSRTVCRFVVWGMLVTVIVTDHASVADIETIMLKQSGEIYIPDIQYSTFASPESVIARIYEDDVKDMFNKLAP